MYQTTTSFQHLIPSYTVEYFHEHLTHPFTTMDEPIVQFYATDDQCAVMDRQIELADGYYFVSLSEEAAVQICRDQLYTTSANEKYIAHGIRPFKELSINRLRVIKISQQSFLWTEIKLSKTAQTDTNTHEFYFCTLRSKIMDRIVMFKPKNCGNNQIQFFEPS
ncbi:hypothetical protein M3Y96_00539300 [Aphelenchoides besseyi]|nr:hypothetical protein M3Y96_00539300 [Aphelenchoides besseyi]